MAELAALPLAHQPGERITYSHATDVLGIAVSRIEGKPLHEVLAERIFAPLGMVDTGFAVSPTAPAAATMYELVDDRAAQRRDGSGADHRPAVLHRRRRAVVDGRRLSAVRPDAAGRRNSRRGAGAVRGVRRLMRTDRLTDEQKRHHFLGAPFWIGRGFGLNLSVVTDPGEVAAVFRARRSGHVRLAGRLRHLVAGRPVDRPDPAVPDPEPSRSDRGRRGGRRQHLAGQTADRHNRNSSAGPTRRLTSNGSSLSP